jgi:hypothetical protein
MRLATLVAALLFVRPALAAEDLVERLLQHDPSLAAEYRTAVSTFTEAEDAYRIEGKACFDRGTPSDIRDCLTRARTHLEAAALDLKLKTDDLLRRVR